MKSLDFSEVNASNNPQDFEELFKVYYLKDFAKKSNAQYNLHCHKYAEIYYMHEGKCHFTVGGKDYFLDSGDVILIPPKIMHKAEYPTGNTGSHFVVFSSVSLFSDDVRETLFTLGNHFNEIPQSIGNVEDIFRKILWEYKNPDEFSIKMTKHLLSSLSILLLRSKQKGNELVQTKGKSRFVKSTVSYVKNNYSKPITLEDAAKNSTVSATYLSRSFKKEIGYGFKEYLVTYRLTQAEAMLIEYPDKTILDIAYECGFNDSNYFTTSFKKYYGITPSDLRGGKQPIKRD